MKLNKIMGSPPNHTFVEETRNNILNSPMFLASKALVLSYFFKNVYMVYKKICKREINVSSPSKKQDCLMNTVPTL